MDRPFRDWKVEYNIFNIVSFIFQSVFDLRINVYDIVIVKSVSKIFHLTRLIRLTDTRQPLIRWSIKWLWSEPVTYS